MSANFITLGISHWNCPLDIREKFSLGRAQSELLLRDSKELNVTSIFRVFKRNNSAFLKCPIKEKSSNS